MPLYQSYKQTDITQKYNTWLNYKNKETMQTLHRLTAIVRGYNEMNRIVLQTLSTAT